MAEELGEFKSQPWKVHDAVVARSFLLGETDNTLFAIGTAGPAINGSGEMLFFAAGRVQANLPWYTSLQQVGSLSYGFEVWQMSISLMLPPVSPIANALGGSRKMWYEISFQVLYMTILTVFVTAVWWGTLRLMDRAMGVRFREFAVSMSLPGAIYFGCRLLATAWLFSNLYRIIF